MQQKTASFLGKKINYYTSGSGEKTLVLLHGFLENSFMWEEYFERWKDDYSLIAIDAAGHGKTDVLGEIHSTSLMADAVDAVLKNEKITKAAFIGHSMGGYIALAFGERYSEKTAGVILLNSTAMADSEIKKADRDRAIKVMEKNASIFIHEAIPNLFADENREKFANDIQRIISEALQTSVEGACACLRGMKVREDKTYLLCEFKFPVHFIAGENDNVIPAESIKIQAGLNKNIQMILLKGSGHMSFLEQAENCYITLNKLLKEIH